MPVVQLALSLAQFAPSIMRFFGAGDASTSVAEKVVDIAGAMAGTRDPAEMLAKFRQDAQLAQQFQLAVLRADTELEQAYLRDRQDARSRDVEVRKLNSGNNRRADVMVLLDVVGIVACLVVLTFFRRDIPGEVVGLLASIVGIFGACLRDAHQFEFGSSRGSKEKDDVLSSIVGGYPQRRAAAGAASVPPPQSLAAAPGHATPAAGIDSPRPF